MGIRHRIADVDEPAQEVAQIQRALARIPAGMFLGLVEPPDRLLEAISLDEPHGVERPTVGRVAQPVDRYDPRVLEAACHLGLELEAGAEEGVVSKLVLDLLEGDVAVQLGVECNEDFAESALGVRAKDAEAGSGGRRLTCEA